MSGSDFGHSARSPPPGRRIEISNMRATAARKHAGVPSHRAASEPPSTSTSTAASTRGPSGTRPSNILVFSAEQACGARENPAGDAAPKREWTPSLVVLVFRRSIARAGRFPQLRRKRDSARALLTTRAAGAYALRERDLLCNHPQVAHCARGNGPMACPGGGFERDHPSDPGMDSDAAHCRRSALRQ